MVGEDLFKNRKGRRDPVVGAGSAGGRGARCALQHLPPPLRPPLGAALRPRKSGSAAGWGTRLQSRARDSPTAPGQVPGGRCPPRGGRPACTPFRRRRRDRALQGSTPGSRFPAERSRSSAFRRDRWGRPENRGGGDTLASARPPHLGGVGWGCRPRLRGCPLRRAPSPSGRSSGAVRQLPPARGELRGPPCLGLGSGGDRAERARVSVTLRTKPFPKPAPPPEARRASRLPERTALLPQLCPGTRATGGKPREADGVGWAAERKPLSP